MKFFHILKQHTFSSLKIYNYRLYFLGQAISLSGTWMQTIAQDWLVLRLSGSGTILGIIAALQFLPILLLGPIGGVIADRFPKRNILFVTQTAAGLLALFLGILVATGWVRLWMIYFFAPILGLINTVDNPTRQTFVFEMVGKEQLSNAVALNSTEINLARVIGPTIAGVLIATIGLGPCFIINGFSYIAVIVMLYLMHTQNLHHSPLVEQAKGKLIEGFRYVNHTPILKNTLIMMAIVGTLSYEFSVILPLFAQFTFHGNAGIYAALSASLGFGSVIGGLFSASRKKIASIMLMRSALLFGMSLIFVSIMPNIITATLVMIIVGFFSINFLSMGNTMLQLESDPQMRGRVMSLWTVAFLGSTPIGGPIIGWIGEHLGPRWGLAVGGFAAIAAASYGMYYIMQMKKQPILQNVQARTDQTLSQESIHIG